MNRMRLLALGGVVLALAAFFPLARTAAEAKARPEATTKATPYVAPGTTAPTSASAPAVPASAPAATAPTSAPATAAQEPDVREEAVALREAGLELALAGRFDDALHKLQSARRLAPEDPEASAAVPLVDRYVAQRAEWNLQRDQEVEDIVRRVQYSMMAQRQVEASGEAHSRPAASEPASTQPTQSAPATREEKLRKEIRTITTAYHRASRTEALDRAGDSGAAAVRDEAIQALREASESLRRALDLLGRPDAEYARTFRLIARQVESQLAAYQEAWTSADLRTAAARYTASLHLAEREDRLIDALADLEALTAEKPWRVGLMQAAMAREIAPDPDALTRREWCVEVEKAVDRIARQAVQDAAWHDALSAYSGLHALEPDNETYKEQAKIARLHVRVLTLYGKDTGDASTQPEPAWQELLEGVDLDIVRSVIREIGLNYVTAVDYGKLGRGALRSVRVLAETPQAGRSFPGLKDEARRASFLDEVSRAEKLLEGNLVTDLDLDLALNAVARASERTVRIPLSVVAVEFAEGFLDELDEFTSIIWPHDVPDFEKAMKGRFYGIGVRIAKEPGEPLKIVTPLLDTPAYRAGMKAGDLVLEVEGRATEDLGIDKLVRMIMGPRGTKVRLKIKRQGILEPLDVEIVRDEIHNQTVEGWQRRPDGLWDFRIDPDHGIGYLRVTQFTEDTMKETEEAFAQMAPAGVRSLVLDLRGNPGGLLQEAARMSDEFLSSGTIVSTMGRQTPRSEIDARSQGRFLDGSIVVLVNEASASAAEIVSGALKDHHRATIVGERTFGKGSVQKVIPIEPHLARLKVTTAYYYLPSGKCLHRQNHNKDWGVDPDIDVPFTYKQMRRWNTIRQKTELIREIDSRELRSDLVRQFEADMPLQTGVLILRLQQIQGAPATRPEEPTPATSFVTR